MTSLQGASLREMTLGKKLPTSASMGRSLSLSMKLAGVRAGKGADAVGDVVERVDFEGELHAALGAELVHQDAGAGVAGDVFEEEGGAAGVLRGAGAAPSLAVRSAISAISRMGETAAVMCLSSPALSS